MKNNLFWKFNKYAFEELALLIISSICVFLLTYFINNKFAYLFILDVLGLIQVIRSFMFYKLRVESYFRIKKMFEEKGVKNSILMDLDSGPCTSTISEQLRIDFNLKD